MNKNHIIYLTIAILITLTTWGCKGNSPIEKGNFDLSFIPMVNGERIVRGDTMTNIEGRSYKLDLMLMYVADITLITQDNEEVLLSEINLFDLMEGGAARSGEDNPAIASFTDIDVNDFKGIKLGIGVPDRLNVDPASYPIGHPLDIGNSMYWSWRTGYKYLSMEGAIDGSPDMKGDSLNLPLGYHTGKDSIDSPNIIYREVSFESTGDAFSIEPGKTLSFEIEIDVNRMFYNETDTIDMVHNNISHSNPGAKFELSSAITDNLVNGAMKKRPF